MNINTFVVMETLVYIILAVTLGKYIQQRTKNNVYTIFNYIIWGFIAILSLLLNLNKIIYFISFIFVGSLILVGYIFTRFKFNFETNQNKDNIMLFFYLLLGISIVSVVGFVLSKKYMLFMASSSAPQGAPGEVGPIGKTGEVYFVENLPEKCYNEVINHIEELLVSIKKINKIPYKSKEYQLNNTYLKNNIRRICYSKQFLDPFYGFGSVSNDSLAIPQCVNHPYPSRRICSNTDNFGNEIQCEKNNDCFINTEYNYDNIYRERIALLKNEVSTWIKIILKNNCEEDIKLKESLGGKKYETLEDIGIDENDLRNYNNKMGHKFLDDHFFNDAYWDKHLVKTLNNNPFDIIKSRPLWNWGIPVPNVSQNCQLS